MERLKQMSLKRAHFTIAFYNMTIALILSLLTLWGCVELRSQLVPQDVTINIYSDPVTISQMQEPTTQAVFIAQIISVVQMLLPILIYMIALFTTASMFYHLKLKKPLEILTKGASRIIDNDLDFMIESKSQDELGQLCIAFETMRKTLLANNRELWRQTEERKRLNAAFSHNLRNPITVLKGSAKLAGNCIAKGTPDIEQLINHLILIENYTNRIERYVETMSSIQKLEEIPVERRCTDWNSLTSEIENAIYLLGLDSEKQIKFLASAYQKPVFIDKSILFQILENLISNALRFAVHEIEVICSIAGGQFRLFVTDDGGGFSANLIKDGIQPFQKGNEDKEHFGMGLYICELLCRKHGGGITIKNNQTGTMVSAILTIK